MRYRFVLYAVLAFCVLGTALSLPQNTYAGNIGGGGSDTWLSQSVVEVINDGLLFECNEDGELDGFVMIAMNGTDGMRFRTNIAIHLNFVGDWNGQSGEVVYNTGPAATTYNITEDIPTCKNGDRVSITGLRTEYVGSATNMASGRVGLRYSKGSKISNDYVYADTKSPVLAGIEYQDQNNDNTIDALALEFSENISYDEYIDVDWGFTSNNSPISGITGVKSVSGNTLSLSVSSIAGLTGMQSLSGDTPEVSYNTNGILDAVGNGNDTFTNHPVRDAVKPYLADSVLSDDDNDGKFDSISFSMSEFIDYSLATAVSAKDDWTISSVGDFTGVMDVTDVISNESSPMFVTLKFTEPSNSYTAVGDLIVTYSGDSIEDVSSYSNKLSTGSAVAVGKTGTYPVIREDVAPRIVDTTPDDEETLVGTSGTISFKFSEPMDFAAMNVTPDNLTLGSPVLSSDKETVSWSYSGAAKNTTYTVELDDAESVAGTANKVYTTAGGLGQSFIFTTGDDSVSITGTSIKINAGAQTTNKQTVTLEIGATGATEMQVVNGTDFSAAAWEDYETIKTWSLTANKGNKTVCVKFKNSNYISGSKCDTILYDPDFAVDTQPDPAPAPSDGSTVTQLSGLTAGDIIKLPSDNDKSTQIDSTVYYFGSDGKRYSFPNQKVFETWFVNFDAVKVVSSDLLASITLGGNMQVRPGTFLIKSPSLADVYAITPGGVLRPLKNEAAAIALFGPAWGSRLIDMPDGFMVNYIFGGAELTKDDKLPEGALIKVGSAKYFVESGKLLKFVGSAFALNNFQDKFLITKSSKPNYPSGSDIGSKKSKYYKFKLKNKKTGVVSEI